ncbi:MAG: hypothetical protein CL840_08965 [Crocinitomicaceae bacterium]|nr:hypothetical protein [Crocinitomicaceae bacterium]|tara:strand:+ start:23938 stop:24222 length:285 start_codon:yes stop_codon:yes gene_type:complete
MRYQIKCKTSSFVTYLYDLDKAEKELKNVGERLRQLRISKGYSNYEHLAYELGISRSQYGRYEKGANMKMSTFIKILRFLQISFSEFFDDKKFN